MRLPILTLGLVDPCIIFSNCPSLCCDPTDSSNLMLRYRSGYFVIRFGPSLKALTGPILLLDRIVRRSGNARTIRHRRCPGPKAITAFLAP